jgi:hypothetical protein
MSHWGVKSFENDDAADALDAGYEHVHGARYDELMDDRNPLGFDAVQKQLSSAETLLAAVDALHESFGKPFEDWDEVERLALAGVVVRHAEFEVRIPEDLRIRALDWLEHEQIDWEEATIRRLRLQKEIALLRTANE